jgi:hypothetical protein
MVHGDLASRYLFKRAHPHFTQVSGTCILSFEEAGPARGCAMPGVRNFVERNGLTLTNLEPAPPPQRRCEWTPRLIDPPPVRHPSFLSPERKHPLLWKQLQQ